MKNVRRVFTFQAGSFRIELGRRTAIMGILNITPDSFSGDGLLPTRQGLARCVNRAAKMVRDGADIIDVGGESTRPGSQAINVKEELKRVIPVVKALRRKFKIPISVDTYKTEVARQALHEGADVINTIQGVHPEIGLLKAVREHGAGLILMHMKGTPQTMQKKIYYRDLIGEISTSLRKSAEKCLDLGIPSARLILDPGIGFGKTVEHNLTLINRLQQFQKLGYPLLLGPSRKSFIGRVLDKDVEQRLNGTLASAVACIMNGAHMLRVHDVREVREAADVTDAVLTETV